MLKDLEEELNQQSSDKTEESDVRRDECIGEPNQNTVFFHQADGKNDDAVAWNGIGEEERGRGQRKGEE